VNRFPLAAYEYRYRAFAPDVPPFGLPKTIVIVLSGRGRLAWSHRVAQWRPVQYPLVERGFRTESISFRQPSLRRIVELA
jgi:hypothetical protein